MPHVLGIPLMKGNSNSVIVGSISPDHETNNVTEGRFVALMRGTIEPVVANTNQGRTFGIGFDVNESSRKLSIVRMAELVLVRTDGTANAIGDVATYDEETGLISAEDENATHFINGRIRSGLQAGINGRTGETVEDCVLIDFGVGADIDPDRGVRGDTLSKKIDAAKPDSETTVTGQLGKRAKK